MSGMCTMAPNVVNQYLFLAIWWALVILIGESVSNSLFDMTTWSVSIKFNLNHILLAGLNGLNILLTVTEFVPIRFYRDKIVSLLNTNTSLHETTEGYQGFLFNSILLLFLQ